MVFSAIFPALSESVGDPSAYESAQHRVGTGRVAQAAAKIQCEIDAGAVTVPADSTVAR